MSCNKDITTIGNYWYRSNDIAKLQERKHKLSAEFHDDLRHRVFYADI